MKWLASIAVTIVLLSGNISAWGEELTLEQLYPAKWLRAMEIRADDAYQQATGKFCDFDGESRGNFTYFSPDVKDLQVAKGVMRFRTGGPKVLLGWGNFRDAQPRGERVELWQSGLIELRVKQSVADETIWSVQTYRGARQSAGAGEQKLKGTEWKTLTFRYGTRDAPPDAFSLTITGPADNQTEFDSVRVYIFSHHGYYRKVFTLPVGKIWRAIINAGPVDIWVNGKQVPFQKPWLWHTNPADLAPFLKPGKNVIALYGERIENWKDRGYDPYVYVQGQAIMASGETISLATDDTWRGNPKPVPGWTEVGFDDSGWQKPPVATIYHYKFDSYPAYEGRLLLENPTGKRLFFADNQPMMIRVRIPVGLAAQQPEIGWVLNSVTEQGEQEIERGTATKCRPTKDSLIFDVNLGQRLRGVYSFGASLEIGGKVVEEHQAEPVVVVGHIPMQEVAGNTYEEGMKLVLEDTIDFTNPQDPHAWVESDVGPREQPAPAITTPRIIRKEGLVYRETTPKRGAMFSYQFRFQQPGSFYMFVLEYPDDAQRGTAVNVCTGSNNIFGGSRAGPGVLTGGKFPLTDKMQELRWICAGNEGINTIDVVSAMTGKPAAAARVRIYRIEELPALKVNYSGQRWLGLHTERGWVYMVTFGGQGSRLPSRPEGLSQREWFVRQFVNWLGSAERYVQYLRFTGQNLHVMGVFQYTKENLSYVPAPAIPTARLIPDYRDVLVKMAEHNGVRIIAGIEYQSHDHGASSDFCDPQVQEEILSVADDLVEKYGDSPAFMGVNFMVYPGWGNPSFGWGEERDYGDFAIAAFEKDTGIKVPVDPKDPERFAKRKEFLNSEQMKEKWIGWRCGKVREMLLKVRDRMRTKRRDLQCFAMHYHDISGMGHMLSRWLESGKTYQEFVRELGYDPSLFRKDDGVWFGRYLHTGQMRLSYLRQQDRYATGWEQNVGAEPIAFYDQPRNRAIMILQHFDELGYRIPGVPWKSGYRDYKIPEGVPDWPWLGSLGPFYHQYQGPRAMEPYTQGLIGADPNLVMFGWCDSTALVGTEQPLREFARAYLSLPGDKFWQVANTGFDTNLAIRDLRRGRAYYFYVANPGYWPIKGEVVIREAGRVVDLAANQVAQVRKEGGKLLVPVSLKPYGVAAYRVDGAKAKVESWTTEPVTDQFLVHIRSQITQATNFATRPEVKKIMSKEDLAFVQQTTEQVTADLAENKVARAWSAVTNWKFWSLLHDTMLKASEKRAWMVIGPFKNDHEEGVEFKRALPVEKEVLAQGRAATEKQYDGIDERGKAVPVKWKKVLSASQPHQGRPNYVDLDVAFRPNEWVMAYAFSYVYSPETRKATLSAGSDDGLRVWLNGKLVIDHYEARAAAPDQDQVEVELRKGWNSILVKIEERIGGWGFFLDFLDGEGKLLEDIEYSTEVQVQAAYSCRLAGITIQDIAWKNEKVFTTRYHYLWGTDGTGQHVGARFSGEKPSSGFSFVPIRGAPGERTLAYQDSSSQAIGYRQQIHLLPDRITWEMEYEAKERLAVKGMPFFRLELVGVSPLLWGCPVKFVDAQGEKVVQMPPIDPKIEKPVRLSRNGLRAIEFQTAQGPIRVKFESSDQQHTDLRAYGVGEPGKDEKPANYEWSISVWTSAQGGMIPAGYRNKAKLSLIFGSTT